MSAQPDAHGGYLVRAETLEGVDVRGLARAALERDGQPVAAAGLLVSLSLPERVIRLAFDGPHTYGRGGAAWYRDHHALAEALSRVLPLTVHAYAFDPEGFEGVATYGAGSRVGGETVRYDDLDLELDELTESEFEALREAWPLGRLAQVLGMTRGQLLRLPYAPGSLLPLEGPPPDPGRGG